MPQIQIGPDAAAVGAAVAGRIVDDLTTALRGGRRFVLGCPGGRTPVSTYHALAALAAARELDLSGLVIAMMDDYVVPDGTSWRNVDGDAHYSCRRFARVEIQGVLNRVLPTDRWVRDEHVWFPDPKDPAAYEERIADAGGIDCFLLASGAGDGHVAFNPPGSPVDSLTRIVRLGEQTRRDNLATFPGFGGLDDVPTHGVTIGIGTIVRHSASAPMILLGADKRHAYTRLTTGEGYDPEWPATVYRLVPPAMLYADRAAAGESPDREQR
ncbi:glucosamine-6-phosphate deaminase [Naumannella cuiyingiana]|uniref:Glucosamine-6-phosphate deaminase n=1 Tax=Naumannella cuiyingiana TaxID=1347891 RepID=A0A7Z0IMK6_9ACTN|nr:6-phosphogluconolactonase [Naumannella cuiyingiana]NYI72697.1 glucosamine-6-phosphate deaminase [Naumannella cuiyingiana]